MDSTRESIKKVIKNNLHIELQDHSALTDIHKFKGILKILDTDLDRIADNIIEITRLGK